MQLFKDIKKQSVQEGKKFYKSFDSLRFPQDFLSLSGFKDIYQGLIIFGSYALAASVLPIVLNIISTPLALLTFSLGAAVTLFGLYHHIQNPNKSFEVLSKFEVQGNHLALAGSIMMGIAPLITILSIIIPALLCATAISRAYATIPEETRNNISDLITNSMRPC